MKNKMFCRQCQETAEGKGCTFAGVCGKKSELARLQDLLVWTTKGLAHIATRLRGEGKSVDSETDRMVTTNLFMTITNANFDAKAISEAITKTLAVKRALGAKLEDRTNLSEAALWDGDEADYPAKAATVGVFDSTCIDEDVRSLRELVTYGIKGLSAYMKHANALRHDNPECNAFLQEALGATLDDTLDADALAELALETGKFGVKAMDLLDKANTSRYGNPEITQIALHVRKNPGILISGHDLGDLEMLLEQSKDAGIDVYTHCEMLPAHCYPAFKKYPHLAGNYGNAWWRQREEFEKFNGPILMTSNCIVPPPPGVAYGKRIWTTGAAGYPGCPHIESDRNGLKDFSGIIEQAKSCKPPEPLEDGTITGGFARAQTLALADKIVEAVKSGAIRKFVVMAGCDGRMPSRAYYTEFAKALPEDTVILTAGCAKFRYNKLDLGDIGGIPRVLDAGQCNDSYSLAVIATKLKEAFGLDDINEFPIVYNIAWYEQKAIIVLLALLYLGVKNIHLGPTLPAFLSPNVAELLEKRFGVSGIGTADEDMARFRLAY